MKFTTSFVLAAAAILNQASAGSTSLVKFSGIGYSGHYSDVTKMDDSTGKCSSSKKTFSGNLAPFNEDLSVHIRGPIKLKKFAVYTTTSSSKKKRSDENCDEQVNLKRHVHHVHKRQNGVATVDVTQTVFVTQGDDATTTAAPSSVSVVNSAQNKVIDKYHTTDVDSFTSAQSSSTSETSSSSTSSSSSPSSSSSSGSGGDWTRSSYYSASDSTSDNVVFMNHKGPFSMKFGSGIGYADSKGTGSSSSAVTLSDTLLESDEEVVLFSGEDCDNDCGYYRSDIPAKKGWSGAQKIFAFNFKMPTSQKSSTNNNDMPAVWLLNGRIPRTTQYGDESCSCWSTGCGELDLWEVISSGSSQMVNHIHDGQSTEGVKDGSRWGGGGSGDSFDRPLNDYVTLLAILDGSDIYLTKADDFDFDSSISSSDISSWTSGTASAASLV